MSTGAYIGLNGSAKKIKNIYLGVGNVAKKVKKAYIGVGGSAKLWWKSDPSFKIINTGLMASYSQSFYGQQIWTTPNHAFCYSGTKWFVMNKNETVNVMEISPESAGRPSSYKNSGYGQGSVTTGSYIIGQTLSTESDANDADGYRYAYAIDDSLVVHSLSDDYTRVHAPYGIFYKNNGYGIFVAGGNAPWGTIWKINNNLVISMVDDIVSGDAYNSWIQVGDYLINHHWDTSIMSVFNTRTMMKEYSISSPSNKYRYQPYVKPNEDFAIGVGTTIFNGDVGAAFKIDSNLTITESLPAPNWDSNTSDGDAISCSALFNNELVFFYKYIVQVERNGEKHPVFAYDKNCVMKTYDNTVNEIEGSDIYTYYGAEVFNGKVYLPLLTNGGGSDYPVKFYSFG